MSHRENTEQNIFCVYALCALRLSSSAIFYSTKGVPMRVLIMSDMEGVSGIVVWDQVNGGAPMYEECRKLYTQEINAAVRGARAGGANEIVVVDCHGAGGGWTFNSLVPELLDPDCDWVAHHAWSRYTELLEQGCDACLLVGMHACEYTRRRAMPYNPDHHLAESMVQRRLGRRERHQRSAVRALCLPGAASHRRRGDSPRDHRATRPRADNGGSQARALALFGPADSASACSPND